MEQKISCEVIGDLLPLCEEGLASAESAALVEEHLADCPACREKREALRQPAAPDADGEGALRAVKKELRRRRCRTAAIAALLVFLPLFGLLARSTDQYPLPYEKELVRVESVEGGSMTLSFDARVSGVQSELCEDAEGRILLVQAWSHRLNDRRGTVAQRGSYTVNKLPDCVIYGFGSEQTLIYGESPGFGVQILPRLALAYYILIALAFAAIFALLWLLLRKKKAGEICRVFCFAALSYPLGHLLVKGTQTMSFHLPRDFGLTLIAAAGLFALMMLGWSGWQQKRAA